MWVLCHSVLPCQKNGNEKYVENNQYFVCTTRRLESCQALFFQYRNNPNNTPESFQLQMGFPFPFLRANDLNLSLFNIRA